MRHRKSPRTLLELKSLVKIIRFSVAEAGHLCLDDTRIVCNEVGYIVACLCCTSSTISALDELRTLTKDNGLSILPNKYTRFRTIDAKISLSGVGQSIEAYCLDAIIEVRKSLAHVRLLIDKCCTNVPSLIVDEYTDQLQVQRVIHLWFWQYVQKPLRRLLPVYKVYNAQCGH